MINLIEDSSLSSEAIQTFILISESSDHFMLLKTHFHYWPHLIKRLALSLKIFMFLRTVSMYLIGALNLYLEQKDPLDFE